MEYFTGRDQAYGILLGRLIRPEKPIRPKSLFRGFRPPQSFRYLTETELRRIGKHFGLVEERE